MKTRSLFLLATRPPNKFLQLSDYITLALGFGLVVLGSWLYMSEYTIIDFTQLESQNLTSVGTILELKRPFYHRVGNRLAWKPSHKNDPLHLNDSVYSGTGGHGKITIQNEIQISLDENTLVRIGESREGLNIYIGYGKVRLKGKAKRTINIESPLGVNKLEKGRPIDKVLEAQPEDTLEFRNLITTNIEQVLERSTSESTSESSSESPQKPELKLQPVPSPPLPPEIIATNDVFQSFDNVRDWSNTPTVVDLKWKKPLNKLEYQVEVQSVDGSASKKFVTKQRSIEFKTLSEGEFKWRLKSFDQKGFLSQTDWDFFRIKRTLKLPSPKVVLPNLNQRIISESLNITIMFSWEPLADVEIYELQFAYDKNFTKLIEAKKVSGNSFVFNRKLEQPKFYWRIRGTLKGISSPWQEGRVLVDVF